MFLLVDTDHLGILQRQTEPQFSRLQAGMARHPQTAFHVSIVSFHEQVLGWNAYINQARVRNVPTGPCGFAAAQVLSLDAATAAVFESLRAQRVRVPTMDLRIASAALRHNYTVLTANVRDFVKVPGLKVEDWTR